MNAADSPVQLARAALGASTQTDDREVQVFYVASARLSFARAKADLVELERVLVNRERELAVQPLLPAIDAGAR